MPALFSDIRNVYCIGRNYAQHAKELGNDIPSEPMVFMKPTHALVQPSGEIYIQGNKGEIHHELELVIKLGRDYSPELSLQDTIDAYALGIDFTLRDVQSELKKKGHPWLIAKGFLNSAVLSPWKRYDEKEWYNLIFTLERNGEVVQSGNPNDMLFGLKALMDHIHQHLGLKTGDIIYTGTPEGVGPIVDGDRIVMKLNNANEGEFLVRFQG